jgi:uncharacterized protein YgbK (DUF1537 family)
MLLGVIGDDFTGSSDIANTLSKQGMSVTQYSGIPAHNADASVEAGVVSLKTRTIPVQDAVAQSVAAAQWLLKQGCQQIFFKYCSTFDSTKEGNIGPVTEALAELLEEDKVVMCPAFPTAGRTIFQGHLFVGDQLLSDSGMRNHPLTPMTDADLRRWLAYQTGWTVGHIPYADIATGAEHIEQKLVASPKSMIIADAINDQQLHDIGTACRERKLLTGGSGLAIGLPDNFRRQGLIKATNNPWRGESGKAVILSGSCSIATREQVATYRKNGKAREITAAEVVEGKISVADIADWALAQETTPLIFSSADPDVVIAAQNKYGRERAADAIETFFGDLASQLADAGVSRIVTAGGETSGAVVLALKIDAMEIGPEIAAGVPAMRVTGRDLVIALKSGNFGQKDFFIRALEVLENG